MDELISYPYWTTPTQFTPESVKGFLPSVIGIILWDWMSRLVSQLHICILWPAAEGLQHWWGWLVCGCRSGTSQAHLSWVFFCFVFFKSWGVCFDASFTGIWLPQKINPLLNLSFIIFDPLDPFFFVFVSWLLSLILFPIFPRGLFSDCVHVTSVCSLGYSLCVRERHGVILMSG